MSICLLAGAVAVSLGKAEMTLSWRHSVQKTLWQEDWRQTPAGLEITEARIEDSGAGMDPPDGARLSGGFWRWHPELPALHEVVMRRSGATADWHICIEGHCRPLGSYLPAEADPITLSICD